MRLKKQLDRDAYIKFNNKWFDEDLVNRINRYGLLIYCELLKHLTMRNEVTFTLGYLYNILNISSKDTKRQNSVKEVLKDLCDCGLFINSCDIDFYDIRNHDYIILTTPRLENCFTILYDFEIDAIVGYKEKIDRTKLLVLFLYIKKGINSNTKVTYPSYEILCNQCEIGCHNTLKQYIDILVELGLLLYVSRDYRVYEDGQIKKWVNVYCMNYEGNEKYLEQYNRLEDDKLEKHYKKKENQVVANKKRSETMKERYREKVKMDSDINEEEDIIDIFGISED